MVALVWFHGGPMNGKLLSVDLDVGDIVITTAYVFVNGEDAYEVRWGRERVFIVAYDEELSEI